MKKIILFLILVQLALNANGQAPRISYPSNTYLFNTGTSMTPINPSNIGGAVSSPGSSAFVKTIAGSGTQGQFDTIGDFATFNGPSNIAISKNKLLYVTDWPGRIRKIEIDRLVSTYSGSSFGFRDGPNLFALFRDPAGIAIDREGNLIIADEENNRIRKISTSGIVSTIAGNGSSALIDGIGTAARFLSPSDVLVDTNSNMYVADAHAIRKISPNGAVTTFVGSSQAGYVDGVGTQARFSYIICIAMDDSGNVYATDAGNNRIRKISPAGVVTTLAGGGGSGTNGSGFNDGLGSAASFNFPFGIAIDKNGIIYVSERGNLRIRRISPTGMVTTIAGNGSPGFADTTGHLALFSGNRGLTIDDEGNNLFVTDFGTNYRVRRIYLGGFSISPPLPQGLTFNIISGNISGTPRESTPPTDYYITASNANGVSSVKVSISTTATINSFFPLAAGKGDTINIFGSGFNNVSEVKLGGHPAASFQILNINHIQAIVGNGNSGNITVIANSGPTSLSGFMFIAVPQINYTPNSYSLTTGSSINPILPTNLGGAVANPYSVVWAMTLSGNGNAGFQNGSHTNANFNKPLGLAVDKLHSIYVADSENNRIRKIDPFGQVTTLAGGGGTGLNGAGFLDGQGPIAAFLQPTSIAVDDSNNLYITDEGNHAIRKITPNGLVSTLAGNGQIGYLDGVGTAAKFSFPSGISFGDSGYLYVTDSKNHRIRKISLNGVVTTWAGNGTATFADGLSTNASFNNPTAICSDKNGNLIVADSWNNRIRKISPNALVTTIAGNGNFNFADGSNLTSSFRQPMGVAVDNDLNIYVSDENNHRIRRISAMGLVTTIAGNGIAGFRDSTGLNCLVNFPSGLAIDESNNLYLADKNNNRIRILNQGGYSIWPALPTGLNIDVHSGIINGIPMTSTPLTVYHIVSSNRSGVDTSTISIETKFPISAGSLSLNQIKVYPNPTSNRIFIEMDERSEREINLQLFDINGRIYLNKTNKILKDQKTIEISINHLNNGIYTLRITDNNVAKNFLIQISNN